MTIWPFTFLRRGFVEAPQYRNLVHEQGGGRRVLQKVHATGELVVRGALLFPNPGGSYEDLAAFVAARTGGFEAFLYKPQRKNAAAFVDALTAAAGQTDFDASHRYVDTATLEVRVNSVLKTLGVDYDVENESGGAYVLGTSTKLVVAFGIAPGAAAAVTLSYDFYVPVRFEGDEVLDDQDPIVAGLGAANLADVMLSVELREAGPGWRFASTPNAL